MKIVKGETRGRPGRWIVDFRDQFGARHKPAFTTKREAEAFRDKVSDEVRRRVFTPPKKVPTFRQAAREWLRDKERLEPATYEYYRGHVELHLNPRIGEYRLDHIDVRMLEERVRDEVAESAGAATANKVLGSLRNFWRFARRRGHTQSNPAVDAEPLARVKRGRGAEVVYTPDELRKLLEAAPAGKWRAFLTMGMLGLRHGELLALQWPDFVEDFSSVRVQRSLTRARGPGQERAKQKGRSAVFKAPKTEAGARTIPLPPQIATALKRWKLASPVSEDGLVFPDELGRPMHPSRSLHVLHEIQDTAKLRRLDVKALRHSFATALLEGGEVDTQVARLLGHADTTVTRRVYTHAYEKGDVAGVRILADAVLGKAATE